MTPAPERGSTPSDGDIQVTRGLIRAGQLLYIEVLDHVIIGANRHTSLRELGYFHT
jgi:DNA repair protein RadC